MANKTERVVTRISHNSRFGETKVLIVVEKFISGKTLIDMLEEWEYNILGICTSSQEALMRVKKDKPDLILTDMELNDCDGIHLAQQLDLQSDHSHICIYFTAYASDLIIQRTMTIATALGHNISKTKRKDHSDFESCFCEYHGIDRPNNISSQFSAQKIKVLIVDDQQIVLWGLEKLINNEKPKMEVVGIATVLREHYPDPTAEKGDWSVVDLGPVKHLNTPVPLSTIKNTPALQNIGLVRLGRLSVMPLEPTEFNLILEMSNTALD